MTTNPHEDVTVAKVPDERDVGAIELENPEANQLAPIDPNEERKAVRKLDCVVMPLMALVYFLQYLDKQSINQAAIFGLRKDLALKGEDFSWAVSLFYLGQFCSEYPAVYLLSRLPITIYVGVTIVIWGGVNMAMAACHNFQGLAAARFFLGFAEGTVSPAFIIITSNWYIKREHPIRVATWVSMNGVAQILGSLLMYGIGQTNMAIAPWRVLFLVCGGLTIGAGMLFVVLMPRSPSTAWFLNEKQKAIVIQRLASDRGSGERTEFNKGQLREALMAPMTWLFMLMACCITLTTPIMKFSATVVNGFGYSTLQTMLVAMPAGACNTGTVWIGALVPRFFPGTRAYSAIALCVVPLLGAVLLLALPQDAGWGIIVATWLAGCSSALIGSSASIIASNVKGNTKKSVVSAGFFISYCVGCFVSPFSWKAEDGPRFSKGCILSIVSLIVLMISYATFIVMAKTKNKRRDAKLAAGMVAYGAGDDDHKASGATSSLDSDMTDVQDKRFRYTI
ncbi:unnamed protein product [Clonostachys rhizophaga]|uniref:Major facilitator superfamily (MFS) profile domain-containing protein n=1 Tax=Clonostachys rhizophaga TaxID=160324 RepID=A0A9N9VR59_9HYPO|nr:unnamed protein product [Clonostachys rhizophaga]